MLCGSAYDWGILLGRARPGNSATGDDRRNGCAERKASGFTVWHLGAASRLCAGRFCRAVIPNSPAKQGRLQCEKQNAIEPYGGYGMMLAERAV
jgi:hypothetical protein